MRASFWADLPVAGKCTFWLGSNWGRGIYQCWRNLPGTGHISSRGIYSTENQKSNRQNHGNLYRICASVGKMFRISTSIGKWWPEGGRLVGWGDGKREVWERGVIEMTTSVHTTSGGHQHQTYRKQIDEAYCLSGAVDRQPGRQMDGRTDKRDGIREATVHA
jgi:hypothetical protein